MPRDAVTFRRAAPSDIPALRSMHRASMGALGAAHYSPRQIAGMFLASESVEPAVIEDGTFFVAESAGRIVGSAAWTQRRAGYEAQLPEARSGGRQASATIRAVFVAPDRARQGIARRLMDIVEAEAVLRAGAERLDLVATLPGVAFYRALGYVEERRLAPRLPSGGTLPVVRMAKEILPEGPAKRAA